MPYTELTEVQWRKVEPEKKQWHQPDIGEEAGEVTLGGEYVTFGGEVVTW
jgi:hypothetical protein